MFPDLQLADYGNRIPNPSFEVTRIPYDPGIREVRYRNDLAFAFGGSDPFYANQDIPRITAWPMSGDGAIEVQVTSGMAFGGYFGHVGSATFDRETLDVLRADLFAPGAFSYTEQPTDGQYYSDYDTIYTAPEYFYAYIGKHLGTPLWLARGFVVTNESEPTLFPSISSTRPVWAGAIVGSEDLAYPWGDSRGRLHLRRRGFAG